MAPLRIFVGTSPGGQDDEACEVLEYSLRRRSSVPLEVVRLCGSDAPGVLTSGWMRGRWGTPWTAYRWAVPEICRFAGRAVYFDCPTMVWGDVAELATAPMPPGSFALVRRAGRVLHTSCIVFDCERASRVLPRVAAMREDVGAHQTVGRLLERRPALAGPLPGNWGASDSEYARHPHEHFESVHFERPHTAPHVPRARARLARAGRRHWFDGVALPHYCTLLVAAYDAECEAARAEREAAE